MLRRYAAGSTAGSGAFGKTTSGIDSIEGDMNVEPLVALEDGRGRTPALELRLLFDAMESPSIDAFEPLRENKPIAGTVVTGARSGYVLVAKTLSQTVQSVAVKATLHFTLSSRFRGLCEVLDRSVCLWRDAQVVRPTG